MSKNVFEEGILDKVQWGTFSLTYFDAERVAEGFGLSQQESDLKYCATPALFKKKNVQYWPTAIELERMKLISPIFQNALSRGHVKRKEVWKEQEVVHFQKMTNNTADMKRFRGSKAVLEELKPEPECGYKFENRHIRVWDWANILLPRTQTSLIKSSDYPARIEVSWRGLEAPPI